MNQFVKVAVACAVGTVLVAACHHAPAPEGPPVTTTVCCLVNTPRLYDGRLVRVQRPTWWLELSEIQELTAKVVGDFTSPPPPGTMAMRYVPR